MMNRFVFLSGTELKMHRNIIFLILIICLLSPITVAAQTTILGGNSSTSLDGMHRPVSLGSQYLFTYSRTRFEPDTAYSLKSGEWFVSLAYVQTNSFAYSTNNDKQLNGASGDPAVFISDLSRIYSVYIDTETTERTLKLNYGLSDSLEFQLAFRDLALVPGSLDLTIEDVHRKLNIGNQGRENAETSVLDIYVWDNQEDKYVFFREETSEQFNRLGVSIGFKYTLRETENEALAFKFITSFNDEYAENGMNDATSDSEYVHKNFDDSNISINYTSKFDYLTLHAAYGVTNMDKPIFEKGPTQVKSYFAGAAFHLSENLDIIFQDLYYTSIFPKDSSHLGDSINELTFAARSFIGDWVYLEFGMIENQTQGPANIDVSLFASLAGQF
jgi:hypothetical protein